MKKILLAMIATAAAISASAATVKDLSDKEVLTIDANTTWYGTTGQSPINVPGNTRAVINIKKGVTLTVYGADASGQTFGVPAIYVPRTATLYITGEGKLVAVGGNGGNGGNGSRGADGEYVLSAYHFNGGGGEGGYGGGGAGAGIGGEGGTGASGGTGAGRSGPRADGDNDEYPANGTDGGTGGDGSPGASCGSVYILGTVTVEVRGGLSGAAGSASSLWGDYGHNETGNDDWYSGGGGSGSFVVTDNEKSFYSSSADGGQGGNGGGGYSGGGGTRGGGEASTYHANYDSNYGYSKTGAGGTGGNGGSQGNAGSLYKMSTATLTASPARIPSEVTALSGSENEVVNTTVTFKHNSSANVADQTRSASLAFAPPAAPSPAEYTGYVFLGYFTEASGGTKIYDASLNCVAFSVWPYAENVTLFAHWLRLSNLTFMSDEGSGLVEAGTRVAQQGLALPAAPGTTRTDWNFAGYWTDPEGGTMVYDENLSPVASAWDSTQDMTLYAHWEPVSVSFYLTLKADGSTVSRDLVRQGDAVESVSVPVKANFSFQGYWTDATSGTKFFNADGTPVNSTWGYYPELTLHAHWVPTHAVTFVSTDATVGSAVYVEGEAGDAAPVPTRSGDYIFLGYFTENGVQVFDGSGALIPGSLPGLSTDATLYAHWAPPEGSIVKLVYRGQLTLLGTDTPATDTQKYTKTMHFRVYDDESATTPVWQIDNQTVTVNKDGSFMAMFGDETLAALIATGLVSHVGVAIGENAGQAIELKPRREIRPVAVVNRALVAEAAGTNPRVGNLVTENALAANNVTISQLEVAGTVTAPGAGPVDVSPVVVGERETLTLLRGGGVNVFSKNRVDLGTTDNVQRGQKIGSDPAPSDGFALITSKKEGARGLRIPGVIQYCRKGEYVRAPASEPDGVKVTFFPFIGSAR